MSQTKIDRTRNSIRQGLTPDRILASVPAYLWTAVPLLVAGFALGLAGRLSPLVFAATVILTTSAYLSGRSIHEQALSAGLAAAQTRAIEPAWAERLELIKALTAQYALGLGVPAPAVVVDPGERIEVNMSVFHSRAGAILLVNEALLLPALSAGIDDEGLAGMVAHELSHLRPGATNGDQLSALLRALRGTFLLAAIGGFIFLGAPLIVPAMALALAILLTPVGQLIARREELEANLVAARLLGDDGPRLVVLGLAEATLAQRALTHAIMPGASSAARLEHALSEAIGFGAPSLRAPLESWSYLETPLPQADASWRERVLGLYGKLARPFGDHPPLASVAAILGVAATL